MEISDIIKTDEDRLFIVDPECYILYTGNTLDDNKPFIRIGNWINMPVELIPLIENIIITDTLHGNPSIEQFNIDVQNLHENRYIGSRNIVNRYLNFQKLFGLDLTNASIVNIEKDIPEISMEKDISQKNQFTGVFYRNGNFKVIHNDNILIDLNKLSGETVNYQSVFQRLHERAVGTYRYQDSGIIVIDHNPLFFHRGNFTSYLFPTYLFTDFSRLAIDPTKIKDIIYPSTNFINITKLLKWKHNKNERVRIYHDNKDLVDLIKKLFSDAIISQEPFSNTSSGTGEGLTISNYEDTYNVKFSFNRVQPDHDTLNLAYVKSPGGIQNIIKDDIDALFISYSAYEDVNLYFKSTTIPVVIVPDGNQNIKKLSGSDKLILHEALQYDFHKTGDASYLWTLSGYNSEEIRGFINSKPKDARSFINRFLPDMEHSEDDSSATNLLSILKMELLNTSDRAYAQSINEITQEIKKDFKKPGTRQEGSQAKIILVIYNGNAYEFAVTITSELHSIFIEDLPGAVNSRERNLDMQQQLFFQRIENDRIRLQHLIDMYKNGTSSNFSDRRELQKLKQLIDERKDNYHNNTIVRERPFPEETENEPGTVPLLTKKKEFPAQKKSHINDDPRKGSLVKSGVETINKRTGLKIAGILLAVALISGLVYYLSQKKAPAKNVPEMIVAPPEISVNIEDADKDYFISEKDIYKYANAVAVKNGYKPISMYRFREKNPDWIYPSNVFVMLDGERIVVRKGDTLWAFARRKLIIKDKAFNDAFDKLSKTSDKTEKIKLLDKAQNNAFSVKHFKKIREAKRKLGIK